MCIMLSVCCFRSGYNSTKSTRAHTWQKSLTCISILYLFGVIDYRYLGIEKPIWTTKNDNILVDYRVTRTILCNKNKITTITTILEWETTKPPLNDFNDIIISWLASRHTHLSDAVGMAARLISVTGIRGSRIPLTNLVNGFINIRSNTAWAPTSTTLNYIKS